MNHGETPQVPFDLCFVGHTVFQGPDDASLLERSSALAEIGRVLILARGKGRSMQFVTPNGVEVRLVASAGLFGLRHIKYAFACMSSLWRESRRRRLKVIVAQSVVEGLIVMLLFPRRRSGRPAVIVESHGDFTRAARLIDTSLRGRMIDSLGALIGPLILRRADAVRVISRSTQEQIRAAAPDARTVRFVAWTNTAHFEAVRYAGDDGPILFVGSLTKVKGLDVLVEALALLPRACRRRALVIGSVVDQRFYAEVVRRISTLGLSNDVSFVGQVDQDQVAQFMATSAVLVVPSRTEGFCRVVLEGHCVGVPLVASAVGGILEQIEDEQNGLLCQPGSGVDLARQLARALSDGPLRSRLSRRTSAASAGRAAFVAGYRTLIEKATEPW